MTEPRVVKIVLDADGFVQALERFRATFEANPMRDDESPVDYMHRIIEAAYWQPEGWEA